MKEVLGPDIQAVLFDWDDTLVATIEAKWAEHKHVARTWYNKELLDEELREHWGKPLLTMICLLYETEDVNTALERIHQVHRDFPKRLFEETLGVVERLREDNKLVGILTAHTTVGFEYDLETLGVAPALFDYIQTSDNTLSHKPDPRVFDPAKQWLSRRGINPKETVYVGDGLYDMHAATRAGLQFIGIETGLVSKRRFRELGATAVSNLTDLIA